MRKTILALAALVVLGSFTGAQAEPLAQCAGQTPVDLNAPSRMLSSHCSIAFTTTTAQDVVLKVTPGPEFVGTLFGAIQKVGGGSIGAGLDTAVNGFFAGSLLVAGDSTITITGLPAGSYELQVDAGRTLPVCATIRPPVPTVCVPLSGAVGSFSGSVDVPPPPPPTE